MNALLSFRRSSQVLPLVVCASSFAVPHISVASPAPPMVKGFSGTTKVVGETAKGQTIALASGDILIVRLPENPTTGYSWALVQMPQMPIRLLDQKYSTAPHAAGMTGVGGTHYWRFIANGKVSFSRGTYLKLLSLRPFEKGIGDAKLWEIQVTIPAA